MVGNKVVYIVFLAPHKSLANVQILPKNSGVMLIFYITHRFVLFIDLFLCVWIRFLYLKASKISIKCNPLKMELFGGRTASLSLKNSLPK
jgi:hypothetical protein